MTEAAPSHSPIEPDANVWETARAKYPDSGTVDILAQVETDLAEKEQRVASSELSKTESTSKSFLYNSIDRISKADPKNVQEIAGSQLQLLTGYHQIALAQSSRSFFWALIGSAIGLLLFVVATGFVVWTGNTAAGTIPAISGAIVEAMAGIVFYLYGKTTTQLGDFHGRLEVLQRYLLANSICESLAHEARDTVRGDLIREIARVPLNAKA